MGEDYEGAVTVASGDGTERELANYEIWSQSNLIMEEMKDVGADGPEGTTDLHSVTKGGLNKVVEYMEMMAKFKAEGTREEDKKATIDTYIKSLGPLNQLFQTMADATFMGVQTLIDELSKHLVDVFSRLTPEQIRKNLHLKDPQPRQEANLITQYPWIDPEGLIAKDRAAKNRAAEADGPKPE